jgi:LAS superfamily LD-carboxypeptidase LdcB
MCDTLSLHDALPIFLELNRAVGGSPSADVNKVQRQTNDLYRWLALNAPKYGWVNPKRLADGINQEEIWHWEWWGTQGLDKLTR